jgi:hypothetical protein
MVNKGKGTPSLWSEKPKPSHGFILMNKTQQKVGTDSFYEKNKIRHYSKQAQGHRGSCCLTE